MCLRKLVVFASISLIVLYDRFEQALRGGEERLSSSVFTLPVES